MTMFSLMTALLSPRVLETLESRKEVLFSTLQERAGVLCVQPSNGICLLQGEWECMKKAYVVLEEFCLQVQAQNTVQALLRAREEAARRGTTDYQQFLQEYQSQLPPDLYPKLEAATTDSQDAPRGSTTPNSYQGSDRQQRNAIDEAHSSASQDSVGHRATPDDYPPQLTPEGLARPNPSEEQQTPREVTQEVIDRAQEAYQRPVSPPPQPPLTIVPESSSYDSQGYPSEDRHRLPPSDPHPSTMYGEQDSRSEVDPKRMDHTFEPERRESRDVPLDLKRAYSQDPGVHVSGRPPPTSYGRTDGYKDEQVSDNELTIALSEDEEHNRQSQSPGDPHKRSDQVPADLTKYDIPPMDRYSSSHRPPGSMLPGSQPPEPGSGPENKSDLSQLQMMSHLFASQSAAYYHMLRTSAAQYAMPGMEHFRPGMVPQYPNSSGQGVGMGRDDPNHALKSPTMSSGYGAHGSLPPHPSHMNPPSQSSQGDGNEEEDEKSDSEDDEGSSTVDKPMGYSTYPTVSSQPGETTKLPSLPAWAPMSVRHLTSGVTSSAAAMGAGGSNGPGGVPGGGPPPPPSALTRDPASGMFQCSACLASFQSRESLHAHMLQAHAVGPGLQPGEGGIPLPGSGGPPGPPPVTSNKLPPPPPAPSSSQHPPSPAGYGSDSYCCPVCGKFYKSAQRLREHIMQHDKNYQRPTFPCPACGKTFTYRHNMKVSP